MMAPVRRAAFDGISMSITSGWETIPAAKGKALEGLLLRREGGAGTFQVSTAPWGPAGPKPDLSPGDLASMIDRIAERQGLIESSDRRTSTGRLMRASATYTNPPLFVRVWAISNGATVVFATYATDVAGQAGEVVMCEDMLETLELPGGE
jgi:hypothetical protein